LDFQLPAPLPNFFADCGKIGIQPKHEKLIKDNEDYIRARIRENIFNVDDARDCEQYVKIELCKLYKSRHKYNRHGSGDWENVCHSMIQRRVSDYRNRMLRNNERFVATNRLNDELGEEYNIEDNTSETCDHHIMSHDFLLKELLEAVKSSKEFTDFDYRYLRAVSECCDGKIRSDGSFAAESRIKAAMRLTKEERKQFNELVKIFREKLHKQRHKI